MLLPTDTLILAAKLGVFPEDIEEKFVRGSGAGGQKITKPLVVFGLGMFRPRLRSSVKSIERGRRIEFQRTSFLLKRSKLLSSGRSRLGLRKFLN